MDPKESILVALRRIAHASDQHSRRLMASCGLTGPQLLVLRVLYQCGPLPLGQLAGQVKLSVGPLSVLIDRLERRGLVNRLRSTVDRRRVLAALTEHGRSTVLAAPELLHPEFVAKYDGLPEWERNMLLAALQRVADLMDENVLATDTATLKAGPVVSAQSA